MGRGVDPRRRRKELRTRKPRSIEAGNAITRRKGREDESTRSTNTNPLETHSLGGGHDTLVIQISPHYNSKFILFTTIQSIPQPNNPAIVFLYIYQSSSCSCVVVYFLYFGVTMKKATLYKSKVHHCQRNCWLRNSVHSHRQPDYPKDSRHLSVILET